MPIYISPHVGHPRLGPSSERAMKLQIAVCLAALMLAGCSRSSQPSSSTEIPLSSNGTVSIDARISGGTRFVVYCNDVWSSPQIVPVVPGEWKTYRFKVPLGLKSLRFDPTELSGAEAEIRAVKFEYPGQPFRTMPLTDLPRWLQYHAKATFDAPSGEVKIQTTDKDMYIMSTVDVNYYVAQPTK
jgi:hypothetical protein